MYQLRNGGYVLHNWGVCISFKNGGVSIAEMGGMYQLQKWEVCVSCRNGGMCCRNGGYVSVAEMGVCVADMGDMYQLQKWGVYVLQKWVVYYHKGAIAPLYIGMAWVGQHRSHTFGKSTFPWQ